ncbi:hypothetical protein [Neisseria shayeganii]|uniref:Lipoprotein n=1 Tax=Neisseria shayeganii 871 TaxID=1032488 RepID=G4CHR0_9NEIS|nr:hypothetical protein [Neisseria shayeganii]EGY52639.1 hypothetical protein HMPREF9371_1149 [Neisseria shayeganii 871]
MKTPYLISVLVAALPLNACNTLAVYDHINGPSYKTSHQTDAITAFGRTKADSQTMPKNELVMLGDKYIYVITSSYFDIPGRQSADNSKLQNILNVKLSQAFVVYEQGLKPEAGGAFPVRYQRSDNTFSSNFCLNYAENTRLSAAERAREQQKLDALQFRKAADGRRFLCMTVNGQVYAKPENMVYQYRFETPIPVKLTVQEPAHGSKIATAALLMPLALAADIVTFPIQALLIGIYKP